MYHTEVNTLRGGRRGGSEPVEPVVGHFTQELNRRYGDTHIAIYRRATATHDDADA